MKHVRVDYYSITIKNEMIKPLILLVVLVVLSLTSTFSLAETTLLKLTSAYSAFLDQLISCSPALINCQAINH